MRFAVHPTRILAFVVWGLFFASGLYAADQDECKRYLTDTKLPRHLVEWDKLTEADRSQLNDLRFGLPPQAGWETDEFRALSKEEQDREFREIWETEYSDRSIQVVMP